MTNPIPSSSHLQPPASSRTPTIRTLRSSSSHSSLSTASTSSLSRQVPNQSDSESTATSRSKLSKDTRGKQNAGYLESEKSKGGIRKPIPISSLQTLSLRSLVQDEEERLLSSQPIDASRSECREEDMEEGGGEEEEEELPRSAILLPPLYGRPRPTPSPDLFTALLQPLLSLSRPASPPRPANSPLIPSSRSTTSLPAVFPPRNSTDPGPTIESQGFVLYVGSGVLWIGFLVWGLLSDEMLESLGIGWYPSREWALLFPAWTIMLAFFIYFSYIALNLFITPNLDSLHTFTDKQAYILEQSEATFETKSERRYHPLITNSILLPLDAVPVLHDLPVGLINRVVLGDYRKIEVMKSRKD